MFKFGIYRVQDLRRSDIGTKWGRRKFAAVTLYGEVSRSADPDRDVLLERILCRFAGAQQVFKRTHRDRFQQFDRDVTRIVSSLPARERPYHVHDVAVSDGVTAVEFYQLLKASCRCQVKYVASDCTAELLAITRPGRRLTLIVDPVTHDWLQIVYPPFVFNLQKCENDYYYPINGLIRRILQQTSCRRLWRRYRDGDRQVRQTTIRLLHPACEQLLRQEPDFEFQRCDILQPIAVQFDLVRAMNILHPAYLGVGGLRQAIRGIHASLTHHGLFVTGSNQDRRSPVNGAVYRKTGCRFERLVVYGEGSPVDSFILRTGRADAAHGAQQRSEARSEHATA